MKNLKGEKVNYWFLISITEFAYTLEYFLSVYYTYNVFFSELSQIFEGYI